MVKLIKWFDRKFEFNFPVSQFPAVVSRVAGTPARLEDITRSLSRETLIKKVNDEWSIQEHIGHLIALEELHHKRFNEYLSNVEQLTAPDISNKKTYEAAYNSKDINEILQEFRKVRLDFTDKLDKLDEETVSRSALHPRLNKPMRLIDNIFFAAEHDDHHIAIIRRMLSS